MNLRKIINAIALALAFGVGFVLVLLSVLVGVLG